MATTPNMVSTAVTVTTASNQQVREPFHCRSIDRWRAYQDWLGPLERL